MSEGTTEVRDFDLKYWILRILGYWYFFVVAVILAVFAAQMYLRYTESIYQVKSTLLVSDESQSSDINMDILSGLTGTRSLRPSSGGLAKEMSLIRSYEIIERTLDSLNFQVGYFSEGNFKSNELYSKAPIDVRVIDGHFQTKENLYFNFKKGDSYEVYIKTEDEELRSWGCAYGEECSSEEFSFVTTLKDVSQINKLEGPLYIRIYDLEKLTISYMQTVKIESDDPLAGRYTSSGIIGLEINGPLIEKNTAFLNALSQTFINYHLQEKNKIANNTIEFIDIQLASISDSLRKVETGLEEYRAKEGIIDLTSTGQFLLTKISELESQKSLIELNQKYYDYLSDYLSKEFIGENQIISPATAGITDPSLTSLVLELNVVLTEKAKLSTTEGERSPLLAGLDQQVQDIKQRLRESLKNIKANSVLSLDQIKEELSALNQDVGELPRNERELLSIKREFELNNELYTFLLKKKSESEITKAATQPNIRVLNKARALQAVLIGPMSIKIYLMAIAASFLIVLAGLAIKFFFNNTISDISQVRTPGESTVLASIPHMTSRDKGKVSVLKSPKSPLAEAFRSIKLNLDFLIPNTQGVKVVGITSAVSGEGKTFCAVNLAQVLALSNKKTLLIGLDLRKPRLQEELGLANISGLSNYLIGSENLEDIIQKGELDSLDVITSGPVPPNPAELITNGRLSEMMELLKERYEYIIIDGPPIGLVTDYVSSLPLIHTTLFVVRMNYSQVNSTDILNYYQSLGNLNRCHILVNDSNNGVSGRYGYGYGKGYGYYDQEEKDSFWSRIFKRKK